MWIDFVQAESANQGENRASVSGSVARHALSPEDLIHRGPAGSGLLRQRLVRLVALHSHLENAST